MKTMKQKEWLRKVSNEIRDEFIEKGISDNGIRSAFRLFLFLSILFGLVLLSLNAFILTPSLSSFLLSLAYDGMNPRFFSSGIWAYMASNPGGILSLIPVVIVSFIVCYYALRAVIRPVWLCFYAPYVLRFCLWFNTPNVE